MRKSLIWINLIIAMGALGFTNAVNAKDEYPYTWQLQMTIFS